MQFTRVATILVLLSFLSCHNPEDDRTSQGPVPSARPPTSGTPDMLGSSPVMPGDRSGIERVELVARFWDAMPTGVTVASFGRIFVCFPRWGDPVPFTVAELKEGKAVPYPQLEINRLVLSRAADTFVSVQSVVVDPLNRLWALDTGSVEFGPVIPRGAKLVCIDLSSNS